MCSTLDSRFRFGNDGDGVFRLRFATLRTKSGLVTFPVRPEALERLGTGVAERLVAFPGRPERSETPKSVARHLQSLHLMETQLEFRAFVKKRRVTKRMLGRGAVPSGPHLAQARQERHHHGGQGQHHGAHAHYGVRGADEVGADPGHQRSGGRDAAVQHVDAHDPAP